MALILIEETRDREIEDAMQWEVADFKEATRKVMEYLFRKDDVTFATNVILKWTDHPFARVKVPPFNVREYHGPVGTWTDFMYREM